MNHRYLMVKFNFENRSLPALLADAQKAVAEKVKVRSATLSPRMGRAVRGRTARGSALRLDPRADARAR